MTTTKYFSATTSINPFNALASGVPMELIYIIQSEKYGGVSLVSMEFEPFRDAFLDSERTLIEVRNDAGQLLEILTPKFGNFGFSEIPKVNEALWFGDLDNARAELWLNSTWASKKLYIKSIFKSSVLSAERMNNINDNLYNINHSLVKETEFTPGTYTFTPNERTKNLIIKVIGAGGGGGGSAGNVGGNGEAGMNTGAGGGGSGGYGGSGLGVISSVQSVSGSAGGGTGGNGLIVDAFSLINTEAVGGSGGANGGGGGGIISITHIPLSFIKNYTVIVGGGGAGGAGANYPYPGAPGGKGGDGKVYIYEHQY